MMVAPFDGANQGQLNTTIAGPEPFPPLPDSPKHYPSATREASESSAPPHNHSQDAAQADNYVVASDGTIAGRFRSASGKLFTSNIPAGMWDATGSIISAAPSLADIRRGSYGSDGWSGEGQLKDKSRRAILLQRRITPNSALVGQGPQADNFGGDSAHGTLHEDLSESKTKELQGVQSHRDVLRQQSRSPANVAQSVDLDKEVPTKTEPFDNGYQFPPKHTWMEATFIGIRALWKFFLTPLGFFVVIYGLLVVAFGGMLFLLLCNAAPAMCTPSCNDIDSPRRKWVEYDSQIVNALFCVTGFGLIPWRFRDLYYLMKYRLKEDEISLRRLAGIHRNWFRLDGSSKLPVTIGPENIEGEHTTISSSVVPYPVASIPDAPLTGIRAPPTPLWKLDFVIWMYVANTFLQGALSGIMWGLNRYNRPSWTTGFLVAIACIVAACGGIMVMIEGKKIKGVEGVPVSAKDQERLKKDREMGIVHFNNLKDEKPKAKKSHHMLGKHRTKEDGEADVKIAPSDTG